MAQLHYGDQEARRQVADVDHDDAIKFQGEGYAVLNDDYKPKRSNSPPCRSSEAPLQVHHKRNDPFSTADMTSTVDAPAADYGNLEAIKQDGAVKVSPARGYENLEDYKQDEARRDSPESVYEGQPNQTTVRRKDEGYTSLGIEESQDENNSENSPGGHSEEGNNKEEREGSTAPHIQSMAKELEDHPHGPAGGGIIDVQSLSKEYVDLSEEDNIILRYQREGARNGQSCIGDTEEQEEREGALEGTLGINTEGTTNKSLGGIKEQESAAPPQISMAHEGHEGDSAAEGGIIAVQSLKEDYVDLSEGNSNDLKVDDPSDASHADTSQFTSPIKSPVDDPKQSYSVHDCKQDQYTSKLEDSSDDPKQESPTDESPKEGAASSVSHCKKQESPADGTSKKEDSIEYDPKQKSSIGDAKPKDAIDVPMQESDPISDSNQKEDSNDSRQEHSTEAAKLPSPADDAKQDQEKEGPNDDDAHGCETFQGDDGKDKIKAEGYNIYSGEPENVVYDAAEVLGDQHKKSTHEDEADTEIKPREDSSAQESSSPELSMQDALKKVSGFDMTENVQAKDLDGEEHDEHEEPFTQHALSSAVEQDAGFKLDPKDGDVGAIASKTDQYAENVPADKKSPYSEIFRIDRSAIGEDAGLMKEDREHDIAGFTMDSEAKEEDANERENAKNTPSRSAKESSRDTEFDHMVDGYGKAGTYGADGFGPKENEDVERELREPSEKVDLQEEGRRPTDKHPLDGTSLVLGNEAKQEGINGEIMASSGDIAYGTKEGNEEGVAYGDEDDDAASINISKEPKRPPSLPHPQLEDLAEAAFNNKNGSSGNIGDDIDDQGHGEPAPKKGVLQKIKDKLTPPFTSP